MPIYEYRCQKCGHDLEVMQKISDPAPVKCGQCGAENTYERLMSRTSFQLKGGGWYSDLYSSTKKDSSGGSGSSGSSGGSGSSGSSTSSSSTASSGSSSGGSTSGGSSSGGSGKSNAAPASAA